MRQPSRVIAIGFIGRQRLERLVGRCHVLGFTCKSHCATKNQVEENQSFKGLEWGSETAEIGLFLASVTIPSEALKRDSVGHESFDVAGGNEVLGDVYGSRRGVQSVPL
jgi:hypothetical protein